MKKQILSAAYIILFDSDKKVLLQHRNNDAETSPGFWGLFGGYVEEKETPLSAVKRECYEELKYKLNRPILAYEEEMIWRGEKAKNIFYIERYDNEQKLVLNYESQGMKWIRINDIKKMKAKPYVINALMKIKSKIKQY